MYIKQVMNIPLFLTLAHIQENITDVFSDLAKKFIVGFYTDAVQAKFFKLCIIMTLLGVYQFIPDFMNLTLIQGNRCVRIMNCKLFLFSFLVVCGFCCCCFFRFLFT